MNLAIFGDFGEIDEMTSRMIKIVQNTLPQERRIQRLY